jgi:hypothetical protein
MHTAHIRSVTGDTLKVVLATGCVGVITRIALGGT